MEWTALQGPLSLAGSNIWSSVESRWVFYLYWRHKSYGQVRAPRLQRIYCPRWRDFQVCEG